MPIVSFLMMATAIMPRLNMALIMLIALLITMMAMTATSFLMRAATVTSVFFLLSILRVSEATMIIVWLVYSET